MSLIFVSIQVAVEYCFFGARIIALQTCLSALLFLYDCACGVVAKVFALPTYIAQRVVCRFPLGSIFRCMVLKLLF